jgi:hypothetical protein
MVNGTFVGALTLPAGSVAVTVALPVVPSGRALGRRHTPGAIGGYGSREHFAGFRHGHGDGVAGSATATADASAWCRWSRHRLCAPLSLAGSSTAAGAAGALASMVNGTVVGALTLPAGSVAVTLALPVVPFGERLGRGHAPGAIGGYGGGQHFARYRHGDGDGVAGCRAATA